MDMMPPQAPPALTQSAYDEAAKAFDRLVALQTWLAAEQAGMPALSDTVAEGALSAYVDDMEAYWNAPPAQGGDEASRRAALTARIADASRDLAELALHDGALDASAATTIRALVSASAAGMPAPTTVREGRSSPKTSRRAGIAGKPSSVSLRNASLLWGGPNGQGRV